MQRSAFLAGAVALAMLAPSLGCSCDDDDDDDGGNGPGGAPQGGGGAGGENSGGQGGAGGSGGDGGSPPESTTLTVHTVDDATGAELEGVVVIASFADGALAADGLTNATGDVTLEVPEGGFVSVLWKHDVLLHDDGEPVVTTQHDIRSFYVAPSRRTLDVSLEASDIFDGANVAMPSLTLTVAPVNLATQYELLLSCGVSVNLDVGPQTVSDYSGCAGQATFDAVLVARDEEDNILDYAFEEDVPFTPGTAAALVLPFVGNSTSDVDFSIATAGADQLIVFALGVGDDIETSPVVGDTRATLAPSAEEAFAVRVPNLYAASYCTLTQTALVNPDDSVSASSRTVCQADLPGSVAWDAARLSPVTVTAAGSTFGFSMSDEGESGDGLDLLVLWDGARGGRVVLWAVRDLATAGSFAVPEVPVGAEAFAFVPAGAAVILAHQDLLGVDSADFVTELASMGELSDMVPENGTDAASHQLQLP